MARKIMVGPTSLSSSPSSSPRRHNAAGRAPVAPPHGPLATLFLLRHGRIELAPSGCWPWRSSTSRGLCFLTTPNFHPSSLSSMRPSGSCSLWRTSAAGPHRRPCGAASPCRGTSPPAMWRNFVVGPRRAGKPHRR